MTHGLAGLLRFWFILSVAFLVDTPLPAFAQGSPALRSKGAAVDTLLAKAATPDGVRVIVTLRGATADPASAPLPSASTQQPAAPATSGPLGDGQAATGEQAQIITNHVGSDDAKRRRWAPRLIRNTPYMAMTVTLPELEALAADDNVVSIHEDGDLQPGLADSVPLIGMPTAYTLDATGANTTVAILDTGVEYGHVFLTPRVTGAACFSTAETGSTAATSFASLCPSGQNTEFGGNAGINCPWNGCDHGTHVAGIAAGWQANGTPPNGVAKSANIFAVQVFRRRLSDNLIRVKDSDMLAALADLRDRVNAGVEPGLVAINMSLGDPDLQVSTNCDTDPRAMPFKPVIDDLRGMGVATVISPGNEHQTNQSTFPGCISSAVTVSATTKNDVIPDYADMSTVVDLLAPGGDSSGGVGDINSSIPGGFYQRKAGTSMAAPHVTGAFAALRSACPGLTNTVNLATVVDLLEFYLKNSGLSITDNRPACPGGAGCPAGLTRPAGSLTKPRIRVDQAIQAMRSGIAVCTPSLTVSPASGLTYTGAPGGPFSTFGGPASYVLSSTTYHSINYSVTGMPSWLSVGAPTGTVGYAGNGGWRDIFVGIAANSLPIGTYNATLSFINTGDGQGNTTRNVSLVVRAFGAHDFNGSGSSDILWRQTGGTPAVWLMNGAQVLQSGGLGAVPTNWQIVGQADFNGDGKYDLLWRDTTTGAIAIWFLNGTQVVSTASIATVPNTWQIVGVRRVIGATLLLWRNTSTGAVALWALEGSSGQLGATYNLGSAPTNWQIVGFADFNGTGSDPDILWRDTTTGTVAIWFLNTTVSVFVAGSATVGAVPLSWQIVATGDFNADGHSDILWRDTSGATAIWQMNGGQVAQTVGLGTVPTNWSIAETGDFNADGKADILWRDTSSGTAAIWFMNGLQVSSTASVATVGLDWTIQNVNAN
jgi:subtilisin family serine protease